MSQAQEAGYNGQIQEAALLILNSRDRVTALRGGAGGGKTRMMQATVQAIEAGWKKVFAFAPSAETARGVVRQEGFANAETVERLLTDREIQAQVECGASPFIRILLNLRSSCFNSTNSLGPCG